MQGEWVVPCAAECGLGFQFSSRPRKSLFHEKNKGALDKEKVKEATEPNSERTLNMV